MQTKKEDSMNRREFLAPAAAAAAFTIVPRHVLGGPGYVPPSDKVALAHIGCGTEGTRELVTGLIQNEQIQIVAVCDPVKDGTNYLDWSRNGIRDSIRRLLEDPTLGSGLPGDSRRPGSVSADRREVLRQDQGASNYKVAAYADFRELLEKEKDIDAVKIMTPDHLHAAIALAAMNKGKGVAVHKPLANRMNEAKLIIETARKTKVATHFLAWGWSTREQDCSQDQRGVIGPLREVHNWTDRPVWQQFTEIPTERPPVPEGFDWQMWLGPERDRPYHPDYTHMVFRSWYDFGGGCIADVGIYSLWPVFTALNLGPPISARAWATHTCNDHGHVANPVENDFAFPTASTIQFQYAARADMARHGCVLVRRRHATAHSRIGRGRRGDSARGHAVGRRQRKDPDRRSGGARLITAKGVEPLFPEDAAAKGAPERAGARGAEVRAKPVTPAARTSGCRPSREDAPSPGNFLNAGPISETVCLAAVALRAGRQKSGVRVYPRADQAAIRQREHEDHQCSRSEQVPDSRLSAGMGAVRRSASSRGRRHVRQGDVKHG